MVDEGLPELIGFYEGYSQINEAADIEQGRKEALEVRHSAFADHVLQAAEQRLRAIGERDKSKIDIDIAQRLADQSVELARVSEQLSRGVMERKSAIERRTTSAIDTVRLERGDQSPRHADLLRRREEAEKSFNRVFVAVKQRPLRVHYERTYLPAVAGLIAFETPLNALAFANFFEEDGLVPIALALGAGLLLLFLSHLTGLTIRRMMGDRELMSRITRIIVSALYLLAALVLVYILSELREVYLTVRAMASGSVNVLDIISSAGATVDVLTLFKTALDLRLDGVGLSLMVFNVLIYGGGCALAFFRHDPHVDYEKVTRSRDAAEDRLVSYLQAAATEIAQLREEANDELSQLDSISELETRGRDELVAKKERIEMARHHIHGLIDAVSARRSAAYRQGFYLALPAPQLAGTSA